MNLRRVTHLKKHSDNNGVIIYWMSRDQRINDNWALIFAFRLSKEYNREVIIFFNVVDSFLNATWRQYSFMLKGLQELEQECKNRNINFIIKAGEPINNLKKLVNEFNASHIITEFDPLRIKQNWKTQLTQNINANIYEVDAHNIVPCRIASSKQEFGAYTLRPKIKKLLPEFLDDFPALPELKKSLNLPPVNWKKIIVQLKVDKTVGEILNITPGETAAKTLLNDFIHSGLNNYASDKNNPNKQATSNLSPYLHFGQISAQRIAIDILKMRPSDENVASFLEELIVRKELSDNFCFYNPQYDTFNSFPQWAQKTLREHWKDEREFIYSFDQFENAQTHDKLWNSAQLEMTKTGRMHGYMRMYWAKKILEWSITPQEALKTAITLNDKYQLDGRDPNGYAGCAWSIGGTPNIWKNKIYELQRL